MTVRAPGSQDDSAASHGAASAAASSSSSSPSYAAFIPALARPGASAPPPPSISERLAQSRAEGRRRAYNEAQRQKQQDQLAEQTLGSPSAPTLVNASSASSRAGTTYFGATALAAQEAQRHSELLQEKRRIAGPVSPRSWRAQDSNGPARGQPPHMLGVINGGPKGAGKGKGKASDNAQVVWTPAARWRLCQAVRRFMGSEESTSGGMSSQEPADAQSEKWEAPGTLVDYALCQWVEALNEGTTEEAEDGYDYLRFDLRLVPAHLKGRLLALAGRMAACQPLKGSTLRLLFLDDKADEEDEEGQRGNGDIPETWEEEDDKEPTRPTQAPQQGSENHAQLVSTVDLSFSACKVSQLRSVLLGHLPNGGLRINTHLRKLSLAGWDQQPRGRSRGASSSVLGSAALLGVLEVLPNLTFLSLAGAVLDGARGPNVAHTGQTDVGKGLSDAAVFLRRLSRVAPRLQVLDLSFATGIDGDAIAAAGWNASGGGRGAWPELKRLVLHGILAFMSEDGIKASFGRKADEVTSLPQLTPSRAFAAAWHAAHHGLPQATSSPYLLDHRPGLGRGCFPHLGSAGVSELTSNPPIARGGTASIAARRREAQMREASTLPWSWVEGSERETATDSERREDQWLQALRAVSADLGAERGVRAAATPPGGEARMARCPISAAWVERWELERAKVLDAVQGRWGSAAMRGGPSGDKREEAEAAAAETHRSATATPSGSRKGCLVYF